MNKLIPHVPAYISIPDLPVEEFSTLAELLKLDHVQKFKGEREVLIYHGYTREDVDEFFENYRKE